MEEEEESRLMPEETPEDGVEDCRTPDRLDSTDGMSDWLLFGDAGKSWASRSHQVHTQNV